MNCPHYIADAPLAEVPAAEALEVVDESDRLLRQYAEEPGTDSNLAACLGNMAEALSAAHMVLEARLRGEVPGPPPHPAYDLVEFDEVEFHRRALALRDQF